MRASPITQFFCQIFLQYVGQEGLAALRPGPTQAVVGAAHPDPVTQLAFCFSHS